MNLSGLLLGPLFLLITALPAAADERILDYRSQLTLHASGEMTVTETIRVRAEGRNIRRGIYRDFPTRYRDRYGNRVNVNFQPLSVHRNGGAEPWHTEQRSNGVRVYMGGSGRMLEPGVHEYRLIFNTNRQLGFFEQGDELYFNAIGHGWAFPIDRAEAILQLPFDIARDRLELAAYTGRQGSRESDAAIDVLDSRSIRYRVTRPLAPREGLTIVAAWPKGLVAEPGAVQRIRWFLGDNGAALVLLLGLLAPLAWYSWAWNRAGRDPDKGVIIPLFEPPEGLSPAATRYVLDMSFDRHSFTAAIISLAVKGHLQIEEHDDEYTLIREAGDPLVRLSPGEEAVLEHLLPHTGDRIRMEQENHRDFQAARKALKQALKKEYLGRLFLLNGAYIAPPVLMSVAAALVALLFDGGPPVWIAFGVLSLGLHALFLFLMRAPTPAGRRVMDRIEGFKMYLGTAERDRLDLMRSPELTPDVFESFLPYAYALGVENRWCNRFAREMPKEVRDEGGYHPGWYRGQFRGMHALHHLGDDFSSSFSSAIASASSPPGSSSGSGGGGFSGGGGGGGGGGGW
jgi:uncharacterized membrane protein YgcG